MKKELKEKLVDLLETLMLFSSVMLFLFLIVVLMGSLNHGSYLLRTSQNVPERLFFVGILVAIVTTTGQWLSGRMDYFEKLINKYKSEKQSFERRNKGNAIRKEKVKRRN